MRHRRAKLYVCALLVAVCGLALGWDRWSHRPAGVDPAARAAVGTLPTATQAEALAPYVNPQARVTVVHFWATWCPPCMVEMPHVLQALKELPQGVAVTMVSLDEPSPSAFYAKQGLVVTPQAATPVSWVDDPQQVRAKAILGKVMLPTTLIVERQSGRILQQVDGPLSWAPLMKVLSAF